MVNYTGTKEQTQYNKTLAKRKHKNTMSKVITSLKPIGITKNGLAKIFPRFLHNTCSKNLRGKFWRNFFQNCYSGCDLSVVEVVINANRGQCAHKGSK